MCVCVFPAPGQKPWLDCLIGESVMGGNSSRFFSIGVMSIDMLSWWMCQFHGLCLSGQTSTVIHGQTRKVCAGGRSRDYGWEAELETLLWEYPIGTPLPWFQWLLMYFTGEVETLPSCRGGGGGGDPPLL